MNQIDFLRAEGKTIERMVSIEHEQILIKYTSGEFSIIRAYNRYGDYEIEDISFKESWFTDEQMLDLGLISQEEMDAIIKQRETDEIIRKDAEEKNKKALYEQLKKEFEGK